MHVAIVTTDLAHPSRGNQVTAFRWRRLLSELGHQVEVLDKWDGHLDVELLVAIHARKSHDSVVRFASERPNQPIVVCLSGTDVQVDMLPEKEYASQDEQKRFRAAIESCELATRLLLLEPQSRHRLPKGFQEKVAVIRQSAEPIPAQSKPKDCVQVSQLAHLRDIKDPFRVVEAAMLLPESSKVRIVHAGQAITPEQEIAAREFEQRCSRYRWLGGLPHDEAVRLLSSSHCTVLSSKAEGAPSLISEAIVNRVPVIASRIDATVGLLGADYPALFEVGETRQLAELMRQFEASQGFRIELNTCIDELADQFTPQRERTAWADLIAGL